MSALPRSGECSPSPLRRRLKAIYTNAEIALGRRLPENGEHLPQYVGDFMSINNLQYFTYCMCIGWYI